jgi:hypothetical protein
VLVPAPELLAWCAECRPSARQATHEVAAPRRPRRARKRTSGPREVRQSKSGPHAALGWKGGHPGHEARGDHWSGLASRRSSSTCSGEGVLMGLTEESDSKKI